MENKLQKVVDSHNMAKENAEQLIKAFGAPFTEVGTILSDYPRDEFGEIQATKNAIVVTDEDDETSMKKARSLRLILKKTRTSVENKRKELKEESLRKGKAIDGVAKYIKDEIQPVEDFLEKQERFAELQAEKRLLELKRERLEKVSGLVENPQSLNLDTLTDEEFEKLLSELKTEHDLRAAQAEAYEREQDRIRREKEQEETRLREENEILKKQATEREAEIAKQREEIELVQQAEVAAVRTEAEMKAVNDILNKINSLDRTSVDGVQMVSYESVVGIFNQ